MATWKRVIVRTISKLEAGGASGYQAGNRSYLQVLKSEKAPTSIHHMVVRVAGPPGKRIILYGYIPSRTREALKQLLVGPEGSPAASSSPMGWSTTMTSAGSCNCCTSDVGSI